MKKSAILVFVLSVMFGVLAIIGFFNPNSFQEDFRVFMVVMAVVFLLLGILIQKKKPKPQIPKNRIEQPAPPKSFYGEHIGGLPLAPETTCNFTITPDSVSIKSAGTTFHINASKIRDLQIKTNREIQEQYVSSVGGAIAGAMLFGTIGAVIGGRAKKKTVSSKLEQFLIITYADEKEIKYVVLGNFEFFAVNKAVKDFMAFRPAKENHVVL